MPSLTIEYTTDAERLELERAGYSIVRMAHATLHRTLHTASFTSLASTQLLYLPKD